MLWSLHETDQVAHIDQFIYLDRVLRVCAPQMVGALVLPPGDLDLFYVKNIRNFERCVEHWIYVCCRLKSLILLSMICNTS